MTNLATDANQSWLTDGQQAGTKPTSANNNLTPEQLHSFLTYRHHEKQKTPTKPNINAGATAGADGELAANWNACQAVPRRDGQAGLLYVSQSRLSAGTGRAALVGSRSPNHGCFKSTRVRLMKTSYKKKEVRFGDFIVAVYDACGKRRAREVVRFAVNAHIVVFSGQGHFVIF
jgi:hypothetical protein